jgi:O-antigen/teichoic acid export membrane protein
LWEFAGPLFLFALSMRVADKMDLFLLKMLGGTVAQAGLYGAAQSLALAPAAFGLSFSSLLLSTLSRLVRTGEEERARDLARYVLRMVVCMLAFACLIAGAAPELVRLIFGAPFTDAAPVLAVLIFAGVSLNILSVAAAILTAARKPLWTFGIVGPLLPLAVAGHFVLIPRYGAFGAALVTTLFAVLGTLGMLLAVARVWGIHPPLGTVWRTALIGAFGYLLATVWPASGPLLLVKLLVLAVTVIVTFALLGEWKAHELAQARLWLRPGSATGPVAEVLWNRTPPSTP